MTFRASAFASQGRKWVFVTRPRSTQCVLTPAAAAPHPRLQCRRLYRRLRLQLPRPQWPRPRHRLVRFWMPKTAVFACRAQVWVFAARVRFFRSARTHAAAARCHRRRHQRACPRRSTQPHIRPQCQPPNQPPRSPPPRSPPPRNPRLPRPRCRPRVQLKPRPRRRRKPRPIPRLWLRRRRQLRVRPTPRLRVRLPSQPRRRRRRTSAMGGTIPISASRSTEPATWTARRTSPSGSVR